MRLIDWLKRAGKQEHGNVGELGRLPDVLRDFVPALPGHSDVGEHNVRRRRFEARDCLITIAHGNYINVFASERQLDDTLDRDAIVS